MTAVTEAAGRRRSDVSFASRILDVVRINVANPWPMVITPWLIYLTIFGLTLAVWWAIAIAAGGAERIEPDAFAYNGGVAWLFVYLMVVAIQAMNMTFAFALGMGLTRRHYYVGSVVFFGGLAVMFAGGTSLLSLIEDATDGWGVNGRFFTPWMLTDVSVGERFLLFLIVAVFFLAFGAAAGSLWVRWRVVGLYLFLGGIALAAVLWVWLTTVANGWPAVGEFFVSHSLLEIVAWTLPVTVVAGLAGYFFLGKATPRS